MNEYTEDVVKAAQAWLAAFKRGYPDEIGMAEFNLETAVERYEEHNS